ncbi:MAG: hypothetical protein J3Q66DRAFT_428615 [Benniella sp.]|nr:MAG: hypothetical protein J3Q66DRAFT_428615 [Benniella sp.]
MFKTEAQGTQGVRNKSFRAEILPPRATIGGVDYFLTEECTPHDIELLGLDLGQACVVGASTILPLKKDTELQTPCDPDTEEYRHVTDRLLYMIGGSIGALRRHDNKIESGIWLGRFSTNMRWRSGFLVYKLSDVLRDLGLSRAQLTALAIASSNDYNKNIYSLGPATNYSIIKTLPDQDPREIVSSYLSDKTVVCKNDKSQDFILSTRICAEVQQTPMHTDSDSPPSPQTHEHLRDRCPYYLTVIVPRTM